MKKFYKSGPPWYTGEIAGAFLLFGDKDPHKAEAIIGLTDPLYSEDELLQSYKAVNQIIEMQAENEILREALMVAANRLEGVSIAIKEHGQNIDTAFFILTYASAAKDARKPLN